MFLKLAYLFQEHQISAGQISADSSVTETLRCLNIYFLTTKKVQQCTMSRDYNRPFPSSLVPLFQSESKCEAFHMK